MRKNQQTPMANDGKTSTESLPVIRPAGALSEGKGSGESGFQLAIAVIAFLSLPLQAQDVPATPEEPGIEAIFRDALYLEEIKGDATAALAAYEKVTILVERQRDLAATALYRQGECLRKLNRQKDAAACFEKILTHYPDQERLGKLSRENLTALGKAVGSTNYQPAPVDGDDESQEIARLEKLLRNSPDLLNTQTGSTWPPLHAAADSGRLKVVRYLLSVGADVNSAVLNSTTPLELAGASGHLAIGQVLIDAGANVTAEIFGKALLNGREAVARLLADNLTEVNGPAGEIPFFDGDTPSVVSSPLGLACKYGLSDIVVRLIEKGADVNAYMPGVDRESGSGIGMTPLHFAVSSQNLDCVRAVLDAGADVNLQSGYFVRPVLFDALKSAPVAELLLKSGADPKAKGKDGITILHSAANSGLIEWVKFGLEAGIDVNCQDGEGSTPLIHGLQHSAIVETLIKAGADVNVGNAVAMVAVTEKSKRSVESLTVLRMLLEAGADPNEPVEPGATPPLATTLRGWQVTDAWPEAARLLLAHGAEPQVPEVAHDAFPLAGDIYDLYRECWKLAHYSNNRSRKAGIWLSYALDRIQRPKHSDPSLPQPFFRAIINDQAGVSSIHLGQFLRNTALFLQEKSEELRGFSDIIIRRQVAGLENDEEIRIDVAKLFKAGNAAEWPRLDFGDVVEIPEEGATGEDLFHTWLQSTSVYEVRIELGDNQRVSNTSADENLFRFSWEGVPTMADVIRLSGVSAAMFGAHVECWRADELGRLTKRGSDLDAAVMHGDVIRVVMPEPKTALSSIALNENFYISTSIDGPYWAMDGPPTLAGLALALSAPHGLPFGPVDLERSVVRVRVEGGDSKELPLLENLTVADYYGLILHPVEGDQFAISDAAKKLLTESLSFDWELWVDDLPPVAHRYEPYFLTADRVDGKWIWKSETGERRAFFPYAAHLIRSVDLRKLSLDGGSVSDWAPNKISVRLIGGSTSEPQEIPGSGQVFDAATQIRNMLQQRDSATQIRNMLQNRQREANGSAIQPGAEPRSQ